MHQIEAEKAYQAFVNVFSAGIMYFNILKIGRKSMI